MRVISKHQLSDIGLIAERCRVEILEHQKAMRQLRDEAMKPYTQLREYARNYKRFMSQLRKISR